LEFEDWCNVIWSYESSFEIGKNLRQIRVWRGPYERYAWDCRAPTFRCGRTSVMVWDAFTSFDKRHLIIVPPDKRTTNDFVAIGYEATLSFIFYMITLNN